MRSELTTSADACHLKRLDEPSPSMAKANLKKVEADWKVLVGRIIARAFALANLSQKEAAALVGRDQAQIAKWIAGTERPQFDALIAVERLRQPLILAICELAGDVVTIRTQIEIKRSA